MPNDTKDGVGTSLIVGTLAMEKVTLKGLGINGGDPLDASHLSNVEFLTKLPQKLKEITDLTGTGHYAPEDFAAALAETNSNQELALVFDGIGTLTFWGFLQVYEPDEGEIGTTWNTSFTIVLSNLNATLVETGPVFAAST